MCDRGVISSIAGKESYVDARILSQAPNEAQRLLPDDFLPGPRDVLCSRGADCFNNPGNKIFRTKLSEHLEAYSRAPNKMTKGIIVSAVIDEIREQGGAFVRLDPSTGRWLEVGDRLAREKTGQALRSALRKRSQSACNKVASNTCHSPVSMKSSGTTTSNSSNPRGLYSLGEHLCASPQSLQLPTTLNALAKGKGAMTKLQNSRTWGGGDGGMGSSTMRLVTPLVLQRAHTDPPQLDAVDASVVQDPIIFEGQQLSSSFSVAQPPPPPDLQRQTSTWSSAIDRLPGLLDYDPYTASSKAAPALRRWSSGFFGSSASSTMADASFTIPLEIELIPDQHQRGPDSSSSSSQRPRPSLLDDDDDFSF